jgi:heat shock protein HslJ
MSGIAPPTAKYTVAENVHRGAMNAGFVTAILAQIAFATTVATAQAKLTEGLESPDSGVVCNLKRAICYDRNGASVGLTEAFLGPVAAERLTKSLRSSGTEDQRETFFSPDDGITCVPGTGPCRLGLQPQAALTAALYAPAHRPNGQTAEIRAILYGEWDWQGTRLKNDHETRPDHPDRYVLRFEPDGLLSAQVDCNSAGGTYQFEETRINVKLTNSTLMACQPGSLEEVFQRNLDAVTGYFMKNGKLFLSLRNGSGAMEFDRPALRRTLGQ